VNAAQAAKAVGGDARAAQVGQLDPFRVADDDGFDVALPVDERAELPSGLVREFGELARELRSDDLLRRDAPRVELFDAPELIGLKPLRVAVNGADDDCPPCLATARARCSPATGGGPTLGLAWRLRPEARERGMRAG
jgi:hypothetical protein